MLIAGRAAAVFLLAASVVLQRSFFWAMSPFAAVIVVCIYRLGGISFMDAARRNLVVVSFGLVFGGFSLLSGYISGDMSFKEPVILALKIIIVFNVFMAGGLWIGTPGYLYFLNRMPVLRLRLFFLLLGNGIRRIMRTNREIVRQIRSRISVKGTQRILIARYYFQNMMVKELYSMQHSHAALVLRLGDDIECYEHAPEARRIEYLLAACMICYAAAVLVGELYEGGVL